MISQFLLYNTLFNKFNFYTKLLSTLETPNGYHLVIESFNYHLLDNFLVFSKREDYKITPGEKDILFTLRREGNTILYAVTD